MRCHSVRLGIAVNMVIGLLALPIAQADPLNDTGIDFCRDLTTKADTAVTYGTTCQPLPIHGAQDARYGRDAAAIKRILPKVGGSAGTESGNPLPPISFSSRCKQGRRGVRVGAFGAVFGATVDRV